MDERPPWEVQADLADKRERIQVEPGAARGSVVESVTSVFWQVAAIVAIARWLASSRWVPAGIAVGLLVSWLIVLSLACPDGGAQVVFGLTPIAAIVSGILGGATRRWFRRTSDFTLGMAAGFVLAFVLIFFVVADFIPDC